jgi:regulator of protease activity HflC (stomatin/prohibitin superfamily)
MGHAYRLDSLARCGASRRSETHDVAAASAEREKRATITKAEGDRLAAESLAQAAAIMAANPIALELRTLQSLDGLGASPSNTVILFPVELSQAIASVMSQPTQTDKT